MDPARIFTESLTPRPELENSQGLGRVKTLCGSRSGLATIAVRAVFGVCYALIAAISGRQPIMFMTRVRL